ncbi:MAG: hypothetical protein ACFB20_08170 [Opitutales bacterium]
MTPEELARRHPRLYHVTRQANLEGIRRWGLLPPAALLEQLGAPSNVQQQALERPRPRALPVAGRGCARAVLGDNSPLHWSVLAQCLDDGLRPIDWLRMLNARVFFFVRAAQAEAWQAMLVRKDGDAAAGVVLRFDSRQLALSYGARMELCAYNVGSAKRSAPRRGRDTFAPLLETDYAAWRWHRGKRTPDRIAEIALRGCIESTDTRVALRGIEAAA